MVTVNSGTLKFVPGKIIERVMKLLIIMQKH